MSSSPSQMKQLLLNYAKDEDVVVQNLFFPVCCFCVFSAENATICAVG